MAKSVTIVYNLCKFNPTYQSAINHLTPESTKKVIYSLKTSHFQVQLFSSIYDLFVERMLKVKESISNYCTIKSPFGIIFKKIGEK